MLHRPDVIEGVHTSMLDAGAEVVETDTFQGSRLKLDEWGLGEHTLEINTKAAQIARKAAGESRFVAGSIGPTGYLPASDDPTLGAISFGRAGRGLHRAGEGSGRGRRRPDHHRDRAGHPRGQGRGVRGARGVPGDRARAADPDLRLAAAAGRQDAARHRHPGGADDARGARRPGDRAQLLDRPRGHARCNPLPGRAVPGAGALHPERGPADPGPRRGDHLPRDPGADLVGARRVRRAPRHLDRRWLLWNDPRPYPGAQRARRRPRPRGAPGSPARRRSRA